MVAARAVESVAAISIRLTIGCRLKVNIETILREARMRNSLSQRALADRSSTSHAALSAYENGRKPPTSRVVERLVRGFTIEPFLVAAVSRSERGQSRGDEQLDWYRNNPYLHMGGAQ
jgi:transcriptional regulator with XRE-family HTH domain